MNLLVRLLGDTPELIPRLARTLRDDARDDAPVRFWAVRDYFGSHPDAGPLLAAVDEVPELGEFLFDAYLPLVPVVDWERAWQLAEELPDSRGVGEWVTFLVYEGEGRGLALPDDADPVRRLSLFGPAPGSGSRVSIEYVGGTTLGWSGGTLGHCRLPERGRCDAGRCGGCRLTRRYADPSGLVCICDHGG
jgi:hypothetical protein